MKAKYSIVIPTHNNIYDDVIECFLSAVNVNYDNYEIIISDTSDSNANYDCIMKEIKKRDLSNVRLFKNQANWSMWDNHNFLLNHALGDYVFFLHSDDRVLKNALNNFDRILNKLNNPDRIIVCGCSIFKNYKSTLSELKLKTNRLISGSELIELFTRGGLTPSGTLFSSDFRNIGGFIGDSMIIPYSDCWSELNCALHGFRLFFSEDIFFIRDSNGTNMRYGTDTEIKEVFDRIYPFFQDSLSRVIIESALKTNSWIVLKHFLCEKKFKKTILMKAFLKLIFHPYKNRRIRRLFYWHGK